MNLPRRRFITSVFKALTRLIVLKSGAMWDGTALAAFFKGSHAGLHKAVTLGKSSTVRLAELRYAVAMQAKGMGVPSYPRQT